MDINLHSFFFYLIAILTGICAIGVVVTRNIVRSAAWLLFTLAGVAGVFSYGPFKSHTTPAEVLAATAAVLSYGAMLHARTERPLLGHL